LRPEKQDGPRLGAWSRRSKVESSVPLGMRGSSATTAPVKGKGQRNTASLCPKKGTCNRKLQSRQHWERVVWLRHRLGQLDSRGPSPLPSPLLLRGGAVW